MPDNLPLLKDIIYKSFFTITKGVKIKNDGIHLAKEFKGILIDQGSLDSFRDYLGWTDSTIPLPYYYLMAQRAQVYIMLKKEFTISLPGMIHLSNEIAILNEINPDKAFDLTAEVNVDFKEEGSLLPQFEVEFYQEGKKVINIKSLYLAKRKSKSGQKKVKEEVPLIRNADFQSTWDITSGMGSTYGSASGDKNPIHTSNIFAKIIGFKRAIMQGWYGASRMVKEAEEAYKQTFSYLYVEFKSPLLIPSSPKASLKKEKEEVSFQLTEKDNLIFQGKLK